MSERRLAYEMVATRDQAAQAAQRAVPAETATALAYRTGDVLGRTAPGADGARSSLGRPSRTLTGHAARIATPPGPRR